MRVSVEMYILINLCMNLITIGAIARSRGRVRWGAVTFASAFGALYAVAMQTQTFRLLQVWPLRILLLVLMVAAAIRVTDLKDFGSAIAYVAAGTVLMGGAQLLMRELMGGPSALALLVGGLCGGVLLLAALAHKKQRIEHYEVQLLLKARGHRVHLVALIDTGNRLHEPLSGLPVLIVSAKRIRRLLPTTLDPEHPQRTLPPGFRLASYGSLGGGGSMAVFRPDELLVSYGEGFMAAPDLWVGVYPGDMPGAVHALAPGVIGTIKQARSRPKTVQMRGS